MADRTPAPRADVAIVGAGPAGAIVAARLASAGYDVVVLEAGPRFDPTDRTQQLDAHLRPGEENPWGMGGERDAYTADGDREYPLNAARVKGVGGSTLHWQGMVMRLHERDFELATRHGVGRDWPIGYQELRPYYAAAESELQVAGASDNPYAPPREEPFPQPAFPPSRSDAVFATACEQLGIDMHSVGNARNAEATEEAGACVGYGTCQPACPSGAKYTAERHVARAEAAGARVIDRAPVQRLAHDDDRVTAAVYATPDGEQHRQSARRVVVAAGGVETPRLLLLSRSTTYPDGLANSSGAVGRYFMDHLFAGMGGRVEADTDQNHVGFQTSECHQFYDDAEPVVGMKLEFLNYAGPSPVIDALSADTWGDDLLARLQADYGRHLAMGALVEQLPDPTNRVTLDPNRTDDHGNPVPKLSWSLDDRTRAGLRRANELQAAVFDQLGVEPAWRVGPADTGPAYHHMGTTRMGTDPDDSVVRPDLRTHDVENLWLVGSGVFPTGGGMNPTLTIAALAVRAADRLEQSLG